jgi:predicted regulator of Ras-like GTPase activity (Roadblock/LC7/MglB family)
MNMNFTKQPLQRTTRTDSHLDWLVDDLVGRVAHVQKAAVLSRDGLALGTSSALSREDAEHLSALAAGIQSLANGGALHFGGGQVHQTVIEMDQSFLFVTAAGEGTCLAVLAGANADVGLVAYEMALIVKQVGRHMVDQSRPVTGASESM